MARVVPNQNLIQNHITEEEQYLPLPQLLPPPDTSKAQKAKQKYLSKTRQLKGSNIFSKLFFFWISSLLSFGKHCPIDTQDLPKLHPSMHPRIQFESMYNALKRTRRSKRKGFTLLKAIARSYCLQIAGLSLLSIIITVFTMTAPVLTHRIITYIKQAPEERSYEEGGWLVGVITMITLGKAILQSHMYYQFAVFGYNLSNTLSLLIYQKSLKYPALCQKKYSISQIINYSQVDAQRMTSMGSQLASVLYTPIQIFIGVWLMYFQIGVSFVSGMGTMFVMIAITFFIAKSISKVNENTLKAKDIRMKITEEILDIIRFIKINALEKYFYHRLDQKRSKELDSNRKRGFLQVFVVFLYFLSCPLIIFLTFFTCLYLGSTIDATIAFTTIMIFNILQSPLRQFPSALSSLIQMYSSIKRIEQYLLAKQIDFNHIKNESNPQDIAIKIQHGTFRWGAEEKDMNKDVSDVVKQYRKTHHFGQDVLIQEEDEDEREPNTAETQDGVKKSLLTSQNTVTKSVRKPQNSEIPAQEVASKLQSTIEVQPQKYVYIAALRKINLTIQKGKFVIILGDIGSGKSSILLSILNEMKNSRQSMITINGTIAYAAQKPCIISGTVRQNILFNFPYKKYKFDQAIYYSSLSKDLKLLVQGDSTEIGEKGVNLSGGQKARIALARAIYSNRDILLLDDVISAVDIHVAQFLIKESILKYLRGKTIIMPTHAANFAEYADQVIVLKKGAIVRKGHFRDICNTVEFQEVYQQSMQLKNKSNQTKQDIKISNDQKKIKGTMDLISQGKNSMGSPKALVISTFAEKAIEELVIPEDHNKGQINPTVLKQYIRLNGGPLFVFIVASSMAGWLSLAILSNIQMQYLCQTQENQIYHLYVYLIFSVASSIFAFIRAYVLVLSGFQQGQRVHRKIIQSLLYASLNEFYSRIPVGRIMNRLSKDLRQLDETIGYAMGNFLTNLFSLFGTLAICIYGSTLYMIIPCVIIILLCNSLRSYYMKTQRQVIRVQAKTNSPIVSGFISTINGLATIRAFKVQQQFLETQIQRILINKTARITRQALQSWFAFRLTLLSFFISISSITFALLNTSTSPALVGLLLSYAFNLNDDIISLTFSWANLQTRMISVERIFNFMKIEPQKPYEQYCKRWNQKEEGYNQIIKRGEIQYRKVSVRYRQDLPYALYDVSFKIQSGQKVGVVGRTGAGKSTIFSTLLRIVDPRRGQILLDGVNSTEYFLKDLRNALTIIDQQPQLINSTFRQNLDMTHQYSDQQLYKILEQCNLYHTVMEKDGLEGTVDNNSLSAGEKQLLCICRAFLKKSKIVIIDEATANIDMKNDQLIQRVIQQKFKNSTVLTIAHRLSTLQNSDKILVMGQGRVVEWGSPADLQRKQGGVYAQMIRKNLSQFLV